MNANIILSTEMTLDEKLAAIDAAMIEGAKKFNIANGRPEEAPVDPSELTMCEGCQ